MITVIANCPKAEHEHRDKVNHEYVETDIHIMQYVNCYSVTALQAALVLIPFLQERYSSFYDNELYLNMTWLDPQYWQEWPNNGKDKILQLINYFEVTLAAANFDKTKVLKEWCSF